MSSTTTGRCLCGAITYTGAGTRSRVTACHCADCARWTGGAFFGVRFDGGVTFADPSAVRWFRSSAWAERGSCPTCGSAMAYRLVQTPGYAVVTAGTLDDRTGLGPIAEHFFIDSKPDFYDLTDDAPRLTGAQVFARFQGA